MNTKQRHHESYICLSCRIVFRQLCEGNAENIETQWRAIKSSDVIHRTYTPWNEFCSPPENLGRAYFKDGQIISKHPFSGAKMLVSGISNKNTKKTSESLKIRKKSWQVPGTRTKRITEKNTARVATTYSEDPNSFNLSKQRWNMWMFPKNSGTPKSSILIGFSLINHPFWGYPHFRKHPCHIFCIRFSLATPP